MTIPGYRLETPRSLFLAAIALLLLVTIPVPFGLASQRGGRNQSIQRVQDAVRERIQRSEGRDANVIFNDDANDQFQSNAEHRVSGSGEAQRGNRRRRFNYQASFNIRNGNVSNIRTDWLSGWDNDRGGGGGGGGGGGWRPGGGGGGGGFRDRPQGRVRFSGPIRNSETGKVLDVRDLSRSDGGIIQQWGFGNQPNQRFDVIDVGRGEFAIASQLSNKVLDVAGFSNHNGGEIQQYGWTGAANQRWRLDQSGRGSFRIVSVHSGKCLDVRQKSRSDGANIHQWDCNGDRSQDWRVGN